MENRIRTAYFKKKNTMRNIRYILFFVLPLLAFMSCTDDDARNPKFDDDALPMIYVDWNQNIARKLGEAITIAPEVSPTDGTTYKWMLGEKVISTEKDLNYTVDKHMVEQLTFEVERNGKTNSRTALLLCPRPFEPKAYNKKSIAFLTPNGGISDIDWENITHLVLSSVAVDLNDAGATYLDTSIFEEIDPHSLMAFAHHNGVLVSLDITGKMGSYLNATTPYDSYTFYDAAVSSSQGNWVKSILDLVRNYGFDGLNLSIEKPQSASFDKEAQLISFFEEVGNKAPEKVSIEGSEYDFSLTLSVTGAWVRDAYKPMVQMEKYDWIYIMAFGAEDLVPGPHASEWYMNFNVKETWIDGYGIDPNRLVVVMPAFGLRYFGKQSEMTAGGWGSLWKFTEYSSYNDICNKHADADTKNAIVIKDEGTDANREFDITYYDGLPAAKAKGEYAVDQDLGGAALYSIESDSKVASKSLIRQLNKSLGN